jgi:AcrR family transcriptional regulator
MTVVDEISAEVADYAHGRVPRAIRERQVLALAEELFAEQGFAGASMDELARRAGVSKPVIYALVGSKEQLYRRCVEHNSEQLATQIAAAAASETAPGAQFRAATLAFFRFVDTHRQVWEALTWDSTPFAAEAAAMRRRQTEVAAILLAHAAGRLGAAPDPLRVEAIAHTINGGIEALARWWHDHEEVTAEQLADWSVELLVPGLQRIVESNRTDRTNAGGRP